MRRLAPGAGWDGTPGGIRQPLGPWTPSKAARSALTRRGVDRAEVLQGGGVFKPSKPTTIGRGYGYMSR